MNNFLPKVMVTTIVWAMVDTLEHSKWEAAQGDDLKNQRPSIELNLPRLMEHGNPDVIANAMVEVWLSIHVILATRQDLIDKRIRGSVSGEAEHILYDANLKAIMISPQLEQSYRKLAKDEILNAKWVVDEPYKEMANKIKLLLR